jgi:hypothetical protein
MTIAAIAVVQFQPCNYIVTIQVGQPPSFAPHWLKDLSLLLKTWGTTMN